MLHAPFYAVTITIGDVDFMSERFTERSDVVKYAEQHIDGRFPWCVVIDELANDNWIPVDYYDELKERE